MAFRQGILRLCFLLHGVIAIQVTNFEKNNFLDFKEGATVVSKQGLLCAQTKTEKVAERLSYRYKHMPRHKLYDNSAVKHNSSCIAMGYTFEYGEDNCVPGVKIYYKSYSGQKKYEDLYEATLKDFFVNDTEFDLDYMYLLDACGCEPNSRAKKQPHNGCIGVGKILNRIQKDGTRPPPVPEFAIAPVTSAGNTSTTSNTSNTSNASNTSDVAVYSFYSENYIICAEAPGHIVRDAVDLYKTMPRAGLYGHPLMVNGSSCEAQGYKWTTGEDPCFPGLMTFYQNETEEKRFVELYQETLKRFGGSLNLTLEDANLMDSCKCKSGSFARTYRGSSCDQVVALLKCDGKCKH